MLDSSNLGSGIRTSGLVATKWLERDQTGIKSQSNSYRNLSVAQSFLEVLLGKFRQEYIYFKRVLA